MRANRAAQTTRWNRSPRSTPPHRSSRTRFYRNRHCKRSVAIPLGQGTLLQERDRRVAALPAMTKYARPSMTKCSRPPPHHPSRAQFHRNRHCERSVAIPLGIGTLLREPDRHVTALLAMTKCTRPSMTQCARPASLALSRRRRVTTRYLSPNDVARLTRGIRYLRSHKAG